MSIKDLVTEENWKKWVIPLAKSKFPPNSLVKFRYALSDHYGQVQKITPSGRVYVLPGELEIKKLEIIGGVASLYYK